MDILLFNDNKYKTVESAKSIKGKKFKKNIHSVLIDLNSDIYGNFKLEMPYSAYKAMNKIEHVTLSYTFMMGEDTGEEGMEPPMLEYKFQYTDIYKLTSKYVELFLSEYTLNDLFWGSSAFYCYKYEEFKLKVKLKGKSKIIKFKSFERFFDYFGFNNLINTCDILTLRERKSKLTWDQYETLKVSKKGEVYFKFYNCVYVKVDSVLISSLKKAEVFMTSYLYDGDMEYKEIPKEDREDYIDICTENEVVPHDIDSFKHLFELPMVDFILDEVYSFNEQSYHIKIKTLVKFKGDKKPVRYRWNKLRKMIFI